MEPTNQPHFEADLRLMAEAEEKGERIKQISLQKQAVRLSRIGPMVAGGAAWADFLEEEEIIGQTKYRLFVETGVDIEASVSLAIRGLYRQAIMILRSWLEIVCRNTYFVDHPVELEWWKNGEWKKVPAVHDLINDYIFKLREFQGFSETYKSEFSRLYSNLSKAIHGTGIEYDRGLGLCYDEGYFNQWFQYLSEVFRATTLILVVKFWGKLGSRQDFLRETRRSLDDNLLLELEKLGFHFPRDLTGPET